MIIEELHKIPAAWRQHHLKRESEVVLGKMLQSDPKRESDTEEYYLRSANLQWAGVDTSDVKKMWFSPEEKRQLLLVKGDLLVGEGGDVGRCCIWNDEVTPCYIQNAINRVRPRREGSSRFLFYWLSNLKYSGFVDAAVARITIAHLTAVKLERMPVPMVPIPEQKRIAAYLDASCAAIDRAVETKQKQLETLDALRKSIIQRAVTQGLNPKVKMKIVPMDGIGLVPEHWRVKQLRYVCKISYGITLQLEAGKTGGVSILTVQNLDIHGDWKFDQEFCIDEDLVHEDDILQHGDLLFNWRNGSAKHVGKTAFFDLEGRYTHVSFLLRMRCGKDLSPFYLKSYLGALRMAGFFAGAKDKVNKTFNSTELNRLSVLVPPIEEQKEIVTRVQEKWGEIEKVRRVIE